MLRALSALSLLVLLGCGKTRDEAAIRKEEQAAIDARLDAFKVTLYRVAKTSIRSLPARDDVARWTAGRESMTREEWAALAEKEPSLSPSKGRIGLLVAGLQLREAARTAGAVAIGVLAARCGGHLAGAAQPFHVPTLDDPFGSTSVFYGECKDLLSHDEDEFPTLAVALGIVPSSPATDPVGLRLQSSAFEHLLLGCAWFTQSVEFSLYELDHARPEDLQAVEEVALRGARAFRYMKEKWHYHSLDELAAMEKRTPEAGKWMAEHRDPPIDSAEETAMIVAMIKVLRYQNYEALGQKEDAARELAALEETVKDSQRARAVAHVFRARVLLDERNFKEAAAELRKAAEAIPEDDPMRAEALSAAEKIEKELPDSLSPADLLVFAARMARREITGMAVPDEAARWADATRGEVEKRVTSWGDKFPSTDDVASKARALRDRLRGR